MGKGIIDDYHIHIAGDYHAALLMRRPGPKVGLFC